MHSSSHRGLPEKAMETALSGFRVVPWHVKGGRKVPLINAWQRNGRDYREQTAAWWRKWPRANVGVATGLQPNGLYVFVVDTDVKDGKTGPDTWARLQAEHGPVPETLRVRTPSGGQHYWFTGPEGVTIRNAQERWPGIDIRGEGGYAGLYGKVGSGAYGITHGMLCPDDIAPAPRWLVDHLADEPKEKRPLRVPMEPSEDVGEVILQRALEHVAAGAGRNETGFYLATQARDNRLSPAAALALGNRFVEGVRHSKGHAYTNAEIEASIEQAYSREPREPWSTPATDTLPYTDLGNAERLFARHGDALLYCYPWKSFLVWDSTRWRVDNTGAVVRRAKETVRSIPNEESRDRQALLKHALASEREARINAMVNLVRDHVPVVPDELDTDPWLLNVRNGTVCLRTGRLRVHRPEDLITKLAPVPYDEGATCPRWERFMEEVFAGDRALIDYVKRALGYSLTGETFEQCLLILYGSGSNGKTVLLETILDLMGDYAHAGQARTLLTKRPASGPTEDIAALFGARFVATSESGHGQKLDEALVKRLTGGDRLRARLLYANSFEFSPTHKIWLSTNHKPVIVGTDHAMWRRIHLIPFTQRFEGERADKKLPQTLRQEGPGILTWLVEGSLEWQRDGLRPPPAVVAATGEYRDEMDLLGRFIEERCVLLAELEYPATPLYQAYRRWCDFSGEACASQTTFGLRLAERGIGKAKKGTVHYKGIALRRAQH